MRRPCSHPVIALLMVLLATACETSNRPTDVPRMEAVEQLRIGAVDDPVYSLTDIADLVLLGDSLVLSLHHREQTIRVFDAQGRALGRFGERGAGPGEFLSPQAMGRVGDHLWVQDYGTGALHVMDLSGTELARVSFGPIPLDEGEATVRAPTGLMVGGRYLGEVQSWGSRWFRSAAPPSFPILALDSTGAVVDTLSYQRWGSKRGFLQQGTAYLSIGLKDHPVVVKSPVGTGIAILDRTVDPMRPGYRVTVVDPLGDTVYSRFTDREPIPVESALRDSLVNAYFADSPEYRRTVEEGVDAFPHLPTAEQIFLDQESRAWVKLTSLSDRAVWHVLDASGEIAFELALDRTTRVLAARGRTVWVETRDDLDVPYLVRYELRPWTGP